MQITVRGLRKTFGKHRALDGVDLDIAPGEMVALLGASGSGKSTLIRHLCGLTAADRGAGEVLLDGRPVQRGGRIDGRVRDRRAEVGVVFQQFNLVGRLPVITNVLCGALHRQPAWRTLPGWFPRTEREQAMACLHRVGMSAQAAQRASTLSGGQQQRVAIARTLLQRARAILADEPIASLDPESARSVMQNLRDINRRDGTTVVVSLHQVEHARAWCRRAVAMRDGRIVFDGPAKELTDERLSAIYGCSAEALRPAAEPEPAPVVDHDPGLAVPALA
ncbi:MAG: phosphonates import ATP-binding protein PhnC [Planctomycetota bacterium]|jgi:phosphonate transport system ATP-binding protein